MCKNVIFHSITMKVLILHLRFGPPAHHACVINDFIALYCIDVIFRVL